jgi:hypothetical protein
MKNKELDNLTAFATQFVKRCNTDGLFKKKIDASGYAKNQFLKMPFARRKNLVSQVLTEIGA